MHFVRGFTYKVVLKIISFIEIKKEKKGKKKLIIAIEINPFLF